MVLRLKRKQRTFKRKFRQLGRGAVEDFLKIEKVENTIPDYMSSIETIKPSDYRTITTEINKPLTTEIKKTRSNIATKEIINPGKITSDITKKSVIKPLYDTTEFIRNSGEEIISSSRKYRKKTMKLKKQKTQKRRHRK